MRTNFWDRRTDRRTDRPKSSTLYPLASRGIIINALCRNFATSVSIMPIFSITSLSGRLLPNSVTKHLLINENQGQFWIMVFWNEARGNLAV